MQLKRVQLLVNPLLDSLRSLSAIHMDETPEQVLDEPGCVSTGH